MKNLIFLVWMLSGFEHTGWAQASISGKVADGNGKAVARANIYLPDSKIGVITDDNGLYQITNISAGTHLLEVSHIGFNSLAEKVSIAGHTNKDFMLQASIVENNAVIVTGVSRATQLKKMPFQVSVVRSKELQSSIAGNLIETIAKKAGISSYSSGPAVSKPVIRGLGYNRVLTINDGVRQEGQQWGDEHGIEIDENSVSKIEILKGPASLMYGSDAMAGVLNIITNVPVQANTIKLDAASGYATNNKLRNFSLSVAANHQGFNWRVYGSEKAAADYKNVYDNYVFNSRFREKSAGGYLGFNGKHGYHHLIFSHYNLQTGMVEGERDADGYFLKQTDSGEVRASAADFSTTTASIPYQHIRHTKIALDNNIHIGKNRLAFNIGWQKNLREEFGNIQDPAERELYFDLQTVTSTLQLHLAEKNNWKTSVGIASMQQQNKNRGAAQLVPDYRLADVGAFVFTQKEIKNISLSGGIRYDVRQLTAENLLDGNSIKNWGFKRSFGNFSASGGATFEVSKSVNIKANLARAFRAPSIPELASNGTHEGTNRYEYGNINLRSEKSLQADASIEIANEHFSFDVSLYRNQFQNYIFYRKLLSANGGDSLILSDGQLLNTFTFGQQAALLYGVEMNVDLHPHPFDWLHLQTSFSLVRGRFKQPIEGASNLPFIPAPKLSTELRADLKQIASFGKDAFVKLELENIFTQDKIFSAFNTETKTPGYTLFNAAIGTDVVNKKGKLLMTLNIACNNLTDKAYQNHLSRLKYAPQNPATGRTGVWGMGRNFSFKLFVPVEWKLKKT